MFRKKKSAAVQRNELESPKEERTIRSVSRKSKWRTSRKVLDFLRKWQLSTAIATQLVTKVPKEQPPTPMPRKRTAANETARLTASWTM